MPEQAVDLLELIARGDREALEAALAGGADADASDRWGLPALAHAAARGDLAAVQSLLGHGAQVNKTSDAGNSALMQASARGDLEIMAALLDAGADPKSVNKWGFGPEDWGSWPENTAEVRALLRSRGG